MKLFPFQLAIDSYLTKGELESAHWARPSETSRNTCSNTQQDQPNGSGCEKSNKKLRNPLIKRTPLIAYRDVVEEKYQYFEIGDIHLTMRSKCRS